MNPEITLREAFLMCESFGRAFTEEDARQKARELGRSNSLMMVRKLRVWGYLKLVRIERGPDGQYVRWYEIEDHVKMTQNRSKVRVKP